MIRLWVSCNYFRDHRQSVDLELPQTQISLKLVCGRACPFFGLLAAVSVGEENQGSKIIC